MPVLRLFTPVLVVLLLSPLTRATPALAAPAELPEVWSVAAPGPAPWRLHPLTSALLIEDSAGSVTAIDVANGQALWSQQMGAPLSVRPREHNGSTVLTAGLKCVAVDVATGGVLDTRRLPSPAAAPAVLHGDKLFVLTLAGALHTFSRGGAQLWMYRGVEGLGENLVFVPTPDRPLVLVTDGAGRVLALPASSGVPTSTAWERSLGAEPAGAMQLGVDGTLHAALRDGQLVALAANSGRILWRHALPGMPGAAASRAGEVIVAGGGWGLHACRADTGKLLWELSDPALPRASNSSSTLLRTGKDRSSWARTRDGMQLTLPTHMPELLIGDLLIAWHNDRVRAYSAAHAKLASSTNSSGALN
ncbi:MAG: hypothetical protein DHS20C15_02390 [Planctomycetota bacterium]|nr:MAG: hypothetical protein DHS20C15_02390 [Planctomycetota bacterium]